MTKKNQTILLSGFLLAVGTIIQAQSVPSRTDPMVEQPPKVVSAQVVALLRPVLDALQRYKSQTGYSEHDLDEQFHTLTQNKGRSADEALVILMCFDMGESQEEVDAVISRGRKMLPLIKQYKDHVPKIPGHQYPDSMLKSASVKADAFESAIRAINHGWHSTADNPQG